MRAQRMGLATCGCGARSPCGSARLDRDYFTPTRVLVALPCVPKLAMLKFGKAPQSTCSAYDLYDRG